MYTFRAFNKTTDNGYYSPEVSVASDNANVLCGQVSHFNLAVTGITVDTVLPIAAMVIHREQGAPSTVIAVVMVMAKRWLL